MRFKEIIIEKKKRKKSHGYFFPGYAFFGGGNDSGDAGGDGGGGEGMFESPASELAKRLPGLEKHDYNTIDQLMKKISKKHKITGKALHDLFVKQYKRTPDDWIKNKLDEVNQNSNLDNEVKKFAEWAKHRLHVKSNPIFDLSTDTKNAQEEHHTGSHTEGSNKVWIYVKNRNLVDILRTVFHELVHVRQSELNMIEPGDSYPGSPIEAMADMLAGKYIKIYGEKNRHIFQ